MSCSEDEREDFGADEHSLLHGKLACFSPEEGPSLPATWARLHREANASFS